MTLPKDDAGGDPNPPTGNTIATVTNNKQKEKATINAEDKDGSCCNDGCCASDEEDAKDNCSDCCNDCDDECDEAIPDDCSECVPTVTASTGCDKPEGSCCKPVVALGTITGDDASDCCKESSNTIAIEIGPCIPDVTGACQRAYGSDVGCCSPTKTEFTPEDIISPTEASTGKGIKEAAATAPMSCCSGCPPKINEAGNAEGLIEEEKVKRVNTQTSQNKHDEGIELNLMSAGGEVTSTPAFDSCTGMTSYSLRHRHHHHNGKDESRRTSSPEGSKAARAHPKHSHSHIHSQQGKHLTSRVSEAYKRFYMAACCCVANQELGARMKGAVLKFTYKGVTGRHGIHDHRHGGRHDHDHDQAKHHHHHVKGRKSSPSPTRPRGKKTFTFDSQESNESILSIKKAKLKLSIRGMDCPSCATKVTRAMDTIPSVAQHKVNALTGEATLVYDPDIVSPTLIAKKVTALTGFACEANMVSGTTEDDVKKIKFLRLVVDSTCPLDTVLGEEDEEKLSLHQLPSKIATKQIPPDRILIEVSYLSSHMGARDVIALFEQWTPEHIPVAKESEGGSVEKDVVALARRFILATLLTIPVLVMSWAPLPERPVIYGAISLACTTIIQVVIGTPIWSSALRSLFFQHILDMDLLVFMSTWIAYLYSVVAYAFEAAHKSFSADFFETPALLVTLILLGRLITALARRKANATLNGLGSLQVEHVLLVGPDGSITKINKELVHAGDTLRVTADSVIPTDGIISTGSTQIDESTVTGESTPLDKSAGDLATAGTMNLWGVIDIKVERLPSENTVSEIQRLLAEAQMSRLPVQDIADRVASFIAPTILGIAIAVFCLWMAIGVKVRGQGAGTSAVNALQYSIAVMAVACPCAIVLCVPMVIVIAMGVSAKKGVLFKTSEAIQIAKKVDTIVFDKTGTLTKGQLEVEEAVFKNGGIAVALALSSNSQHPVSVAVANYLKEKYDSESILLESMVSVAGRGIEAQYKGIAVKGGSPKWLDVENDPSVQRLVDKQMTLFAVTKGQEVIAVFGLRDTLRPDAESVINKLRARGNEIYIVSGDAEPVVAAVASQLQIPRDHIAAGRLPEEKQRLVEELQRKGKKVMFVGDGTNDSLALVKADVGVSLSTGTDIAVSAASIVIISPTPLGKGISTIMAVSDGAMKRIAFNFVWSFIYNLLAVSLAAGAFVKIRIAPQWAGLGELASVLPVILSAWSMWFIKSKLDKTQ